MPITAKELARLCGLTPAAVSLALNGKPGVSDATRDRVFQMASQHDFEFSKLRTPSHKNKTIKFIVFHRQGAVVGDTPFFSEVIKGINAECRTYHLGLQIYDLYSESNFQSDLWELLRLGCAGYILLGTELTVPCYNMFDRINVPLVLLDTYFDSCKHDSVSINNVQGAFKATNYLIQTTRQQPGYLRSSYNISNFEERADGFYKAIRYNGYSSSRTVVYHLSPSIEGAYADMMSFLESEVPPTNSFFADNDYIAIGAMRAFQKCGYRIPDDFSFVGFDDIDSASYVSPSLTTIHVPKQQLGRLAVKRLYELIESGNSTTRNKIEIETQLIERESVMIAKASS